MAAQPQPLQVSIGVHSSPHISCRSIGKTCSGTQARSHAQIDTSTGHKDRLARDMGGSQGSKAYAREELVAELASVLICYRLQIGCQLANHAAYLKQWAQMLREEPRALFKVLSDARKAADLIAPETAAEEA